MDKYFPFDQILCFNSKLVLLEVRSSLLNETNCFNQTLDFRQILSGVSNNQTLSFYKKLVLLKVHSFFLTTKLRLFNQTPVFRLIKPLLTFLQSFFYINPSAKICVEQPFFKALRLEAIYNINVACDWIIAFAHDLGNMSVQVCIDAAK